MMHHPRIASIDFMAQYASKLLSQQKDRLASDSEPVRRGGEGEGGGESKGRGDDNFFFIPPSVMKLVVLVSTRLENTLRDWVPPVIAVPWPRPPCCSRAVWEVMVIKQTRERPEEEEERTVTPSMSPGTRQQMYV